MVHLSPNTGRLLTCLKDFHEQGETIIEKEKLKTKPYDFTDKSIYELVRHRLISENTETVSLI